MNSPIPRRVLEGKKMLVVGIANKHSIAYGCARAFREFGAEVAVTYLNEKAKRFVEPLAQALESPIFMPMDVSCHSFIRMARLAAPLMKDGGSMFAMSYHGAQKVVPNYNVMGPVKAALEASCRYLAYELGKQRIRVHALSPGPLKTRAASGLKDFDMLPLRQLLPYSWQHGKRPGIFPIRPRAWVGHAVVLPELSFTRDFSTLLNHECDKIVTFRKGCDIRSNMLPTDFKSIQSAI